MRLSLPKNLIALLCAALSAVSCNEAAQSENQVADKPIAENIGFEASVATEDLTYFSADFQSFEEHLSALTKKIDLRIEGPLVIPTPKDAGGGYTHEKHKDNAKQIYLAGSLFLLTGEQKYADYAKKLMLAYADVYPGWGQHPAKKEQSPGRMFWQNLNESWWLVHVAQGFDAVKSTLSDDEYEHIENNLLRNMAQFLSHGSPSTFNKIHNHGTWACAAVGLTGYALNDQDYVEKALLGLDKSGDYGFLKQLEQLFSPDGYYNEGPYYQRYALMPFVLFGQAIAKNEPERKIFEYREGILRKAIYSTIDQSYGGLFFPINDAIKDKGIATPELKYGVAIAYDLTKDSQLLSIAQAQGGVVITPEGKAVSEAIQNGKTKPYLFKSKRLRDGRLGDRGALDILRASDQADALALVMKNTSQGLGHGHFDKMGLLVFDAGKEILRDYGAARFLNVEAKYGGHYLPENNLFAKQTVAHNALVVDETSHFNGKTEVGNQYFPAIGTFIDQENLKLASAHIDTAYPNILLRRTNVIIKDPAFSQPIIVDILDTKPNNGAAHQYDLPFHYNGHLVETNFEVQANPVSRTPLGTKNGYQYLWKVAETTLKDRLPQITWILDRKFYSVTSLVPMNTKIVFTQIGANDPNFNLRNESGFMLRTQQAGDTAFISVIEPHGEYNPTDEYTLGSHSQVKSIEVQEQNGLKLIQVETKSGKRLALALAPNSNDTDQHNFTQETASWAWTGPAFLFSSDHENNRN